MNILMCSVGRRGELIKDFKQSVEVGSKIISTENNALAASLADKAYLVPRIDAPEYIETLLGICKKSRFSWLPPLLTRKLRSSPSIGRSLRPLAWSCWFLMRRRRTSALISLRCNKHLKSRGIPTVETWGDL